MADSATWSSLGLGAVPSTAPSLSPASEEPPAFDADVKDDPTESVDWQDRVKVARQRHDDWLACVAARGRNCSQDSAPDPMDALLNDETLVNCNSAWGSDADRRRKLLVTNRMKGPESGAETHPRPQPWQGWESYRRISIRRRSRIRDHGTAIGHRIAACRQKSMPCARTKSKEKWNGRVHSVHTRFVNALKYIDFPSTPSSERRRSASSSYPWGQPSRDQSGSRRGSGAPGGRLAAFT